MIIKRKILKINKRQGRNNEGIITVRHRGGGFKRKIRILKNPRTLENIKGVVKSHEYDPNRNVYLSVIFYENGVKEYIIKPKTLKIGDFVMYTNNTENISVGSSSLLENIKPGTKIYNVEFAPNMKSTIACSGESFAILLSKHDNNIILLLPSKELRLFDKKSVAYVGIPELNKKLRLKNKAGRSRNLGIRPTVRGSAMNAVDHPHGGGEGKAPIGRKFPLTPWGKHTLGKKTKKTKKNPLILKRRKN